MLPGPGNSRQYLIVSSSGAGDGSSWVLMGPPTGIVVADNATPEQMASALAEHGWRMVVTSPPACSNRGTTNYIFCRLSP
jgi:hypothetical protein